MSRASKLLKKLDKTKRNVNRHNPLVDNDYVRHLEDHIEESRIVLSDNDFEQMMKVLDSEKKPKEEKLKKLTDNEYSTKAITIERVDYSFPEGKDYGLELQLPYGVVTASGIRSGDEVVFNDGVLEGRSIEVIEVLNAGTLRLDDVSIFNETENNVSINFIIN